MRKLFPPDTFKDVAHQSLRIIKGCKAPFAQAVDAMREARRLIAEFDGQPTTNAR